ncbi:glycosyltransferase family 2 protein [Gleimia hominis]|uniref:glycosyltransferase family 2 protein n=1 Tax=Gleimia hominis TaxID=595468 RepID=UPI0013047068|nr:glycosyltransferase [Gleimia hominis]WIK64639.1 glycosyltransferase [Gleimia hominis]
MPRFSVIIPYYNGSAHLPTLVRTLEPHDVEVIVVDDASTRRHAQNLKHVAEKHGWIRLRQPKNQGPGPARNRAIQAATGEYLIFLDADDQLAPSITQQLERVVAAHEPDIIAYDLHAVTPKTDFTYPMVAGEQAGWVEPSAALALIMGITSGKCYRRELVTENDLRFAPLRRHEDTVFTKTACARAEKIYYLPEPLYQYSVDPGSLSARNRAITIENSFAAFSFIAQHVGDRYPDALEYVYIQEVIMSCVMQVNRARLSGQKMRTLFDKFEAQYPHWSSNPFLRSRAPLRYQLMAQLVHHRSTCGLRALMLADAAARKIRGVN